VVLEKDGEDLVGGNEELVHRDKEESNGVGEINKMKEGSMVWSLSCKHSTSLSIYRGRNMVH
jgi:hypothetical protein